MPPHLPEADRSPEDVSEEALRRERPSVRDAELESRPMDASDLPRDRTPPPPLPEAPNEEE